MVFIRVSYVIPASEGRLLHTGGTRFQPEARLKDGGDVT